MTDPFAAFYPGSKRKRHDVSTTTSTKTVADWELLATKKDYLMGGRRVHLYRVRALAVALGKSDITVRQWMRQGLLPNTFRRPAADAEDVLKRGAHRMFTHEMIQSVVDSFARRDLLDSPRVEWSRYPDLPAEILASWQRISKEAFSPTTDPERS